MLINEKEFSFLACRKPGCAHEFCWICFGMYTIRFYVESKIALMKWGIFVYMNND
jgi:hypothetical protein